MASERGRGWRGRDSDKGIAPSPEPPLRGGGGGAEREERKRESGRKALDISGGRGHTRPPTLPRCPLGGGRTGSEEEEGAAGIPRGHTPRGCRRRRQREPPATLRYEKRTLSLVCFCTSHPPPLPPSSSGPFDPPPSSATVRVRLYLL